MRNPFRSTVPEPLFSEPQMTARPWVATLDSMHKRLLSISLLATALPTMAWAGTLDFSDVSRRYTDAPFSTEEAAGISLLSNFGVIQGNPDGTFAAKRTLNRAEFTKIAYGLFGQDAVIEPRRCFPDVQKIDWFSQYVCWAKSAGAVQGYPDGFFHPERAVNYAEALKILVNLSGTELETTDPNDQWYAPYIRFAMTLNAGIPDSPLPGRAITRGEAARIAAAIFSHDVGELEDYRAAEAGRPLVTSSSSSSVSSSVSSSSSSSVSSSVSSSSVSSSVSSSSVSAGPELPAQSQFLLLGKRSRSIGAMKLFAEKEAILLKSVEVKLRNKILSIDRLYLVAEDGTQIGEIALDHSSDNTDKTFRATFNTNPYRIPKGKEVQFAVEAMLRPANGGGVSGQIVEIERISLSANGEDSNLSYNGTTSFQFPRHQTTFGRLTSIRNALPETDGLSIGNDQQLGSFVFEGMTVESTPLRLTELTFSVAADPLIDATNWKLGTPDSPARLACSTSPNIVSCTGLPPEFGTLVNGTKTVRLYADISLREGPGRPFIQVSLNQAGTFDQVGAVRWTDGANSFSWTELKSPLAKGTKFE